MDWMSTPFRARPVTVPAHKTCVIQLAASIRISTQTAIVTLAAVRIDFDRELDVARDALDNRVAVKPLTAKHRATGVIDGHAFVLTHEPIDIDPRPAGFVDTVPADVGHAVGTINGESQDTGHATAHLGLRFFAVERRARCTRCTLVNMKPCRHAPSSVATASSPSPHRAFGMLW
jgi:hypothetical protein